MARILRTGHHVLFADVDVVFLKAVWPSYKRIFSGAGRCSQPLGGGIEPAAQQLSPHPSPSASAVEALT